MHLRSFLNIPPQPPRLLIFLIIPLNQILDMFPFGISRQFSIPEIIIREDPKQEHSSPKHPIPSFLQIRPIFLKIELILIILIPLIFILVLHITIPLILIILPSIFLLVPIPRIHGLIHEISTDARVIDIPFLGVFQYLIGLFEDFELLLGFGFFVVIGV